MTVRGYRLGVDWSRRGTYAGTLEDVSSYVLDSPALTVSYGRDTSQASTDAGAGKLSFALRNDGRQFSPENSGSPIAGRVVPGTPAELTVTQASSGTIRTLFGGVIDDLDADPNAPAKDFTAECLDAWGRPGAEKLSTPVHSGLRTGDAINVVLDLIGWRGGRDVDPGATVMPWWWEEGTDAATAVSRIVASEGPPAIAHVDGGTFVFRDRHHRLTRSASQTAQATFTHIVPAGSGPAGDFKVLRGSFGYQHGLKNIINAAAFEVAQRAPGPLSEVWSTDTPIVLAAGESLALDVQTSDPFVGAITPAAGTDYELAYGSVTVSLSRTSGQATTVTLTAGGVAAMLTRLAVRATPLTVARSVKVMEEDTSSIGTYGRQTWPGELPWASVHDARAIAQRIVATYATARPVVAFAIANISDDYLTQILARRISDRITVRNDELGLNRDFIIERITHTITKLGVIHQVEFACEVPEPSQPANVFTFGVAGKGFNQGAFGVNGIDNPASMFTFDVAGKGFNQGVFAS
ncbi:hypothetical protein [Micromonospora peucetia]|uniref:Baseplate protein J-like domain-containing protein n=1 Tax=Micromonospora peucetia TaxID=47871 RepID=A0ABZ1EJW2_9ACTN|nr:hypothetical protein [Micromonospora peucetia]WSA34555.1 hypothetical protein OIE14_11175 [Micromonospora peucetia]